MFPFAKIILKLLNEYKAIIKKHLDRSEWTVKINELGLKRKVLKYEYDDEVALYHKAQKVVADVAAYLNRSPNALPSWHSGLDEFYQYLRNILVEYQIENNKVVHTSQQVSRVLVDAVQIINMPSVKRNSIIARKLENYAHTIAKHGSREQQELFGKALKNCQEEDVNFFLPLMHHFEKNSHEFSPHLAQNHLTAEYSEH